jgi:thiamine-monophosphate kinase
VGAELDASQLPLSDELLELVGESRAREFAFCGGDDYELCFTAPPGHVDTVLSAAETWPCPVSHIGTVSATGETSWQLNGRHYDVPADEFRHFDREQA